MVVKLEARRRRPIRTNPRISLPIGGRSGIGDQYGSGDCEVADEEMARRLAVAIRCSALTVAYQPIVNAASDRIVGVEALARWFDPDLGSVPTQKFVTIADKYGLIGEMSRLVIGRACSASTEWAQAGADLNLSVNLSPGLLASGEAAEILDASLQRHGVPRHRVLVEITEADHGTDVASVAQQLDLLHRSGLRCSLDDFGMGQNSFDKVRLYPLSELKIDRTVVASSTLRPADYDILVGITAMAHRLGLTVTAEGVEDVDTYDLVRRAGCDLVQGYYVSEPIEGSMIVPFVEAFESVWKRIRPSRNDSLEPII